MPIGYTGVPPIPASDIPAYDATSATYVRVLCTVTPETVLAWGVARTPSPKPATRSSLSPCRTSAWRGVCASIGKHMGTCCAHNPFLLHDHFPAAPPPSILRQVLHPGPGVCVHHRQRHLDVLECRSGCSLYPNAPSPNDPNVPSPNDSRCAFALCVFRVLWSLSISFTRAQGIPKHKIGLASL